MKVQNRDSRLTRSFALIKMVLGRKYRPRSWPRKLAGSIRALFEKYPEPPTLNDKDLRLFEAQTFSQNGEDGIIAEICRRLNLNSGVFVEIGTESGVECNGARLARENWTGFFIEGDDRSFEALSRNYKDYENVGCVHSWATSKNIEELLSRLSVPKDFTLLSIDIDGNDYWLWQAVTSWEPAIVVIEYNSSYPPPERWVMAENWDAAWDGTTYFGASLESLTALANLKGYRLATTDSRGVNAFFIREDRFDPELFVDAPTAYHYSRPRYGLFHHGHPPGDGPHLEI